VALKLFAKAQGRDSLKRVVACIQLERNGDCDWEARVIPVVQIVPISSVVEIHVVVLVPVLSPGFRPRINNRDPVSVVLETRHSADENQRKTIDAEEVIVAEVEPEAVFRNPEAVIAATLSPVLMFVFPRTSTRLTKAFAHLALVLRNAAVVHATVCRAVHLHAAVKGAAIALLWLSLLSRALLLASLLSGPGLLGLLPRLFLLRLLCRSRLLRGVRLLCRFRIAPVISRSLLIVLGHGNGCGAEEQRQNRCADHAGMFHFGKAPFERVVP